MRKAFEVALSSWFMVLTLSYVIPRKDPIVIHKGFFVLFCFVFVFETEFLCIGCPRTSYVDSAVLELTEIHLPLLPEYWD